MGKVFRDGAYFFGNGKVFDVEMGEYDVLESFR